MNIREVLDELEIEFKEHGEHHHTTEGWISIDCPWCSPNENRFRLGINISGMYCSCWSCGAHRLDETLKELVSQRDLDSRSIRDFRALLSQLDTSLVSGERSRQKRRQGAATLPKGLTELQSPHRRYLKQRGFDPDEIIRLWNVSAFSIAGRMSWRIFIPVTFRGNVVSWTTRTIGNSSPRYISASPNEESVDHKSIVYGFDYPRHAVIVTEGPLDVWRIGPGAIATFGTSLKQSQVRLISEFPLRVICFDSDAQRKARRLCDALEALPGETFNVRLESGKDPAEANEKELKQLRRFLK